MDTFPLRLAYSVDEAAIILGIGKTKLYELIGNSEIQALKSGKRTLIPFSSLKSWIETLPPIHGGK